MMKQLFLVIVSIIFSTSNSPAETDQFDVMPDTSILGSWWGEFLDIRSGYHRIVLTIDSENSDSCFGTIYYETFEVHYQHGIPPSAYKFQPLPFSAKRNRNELSGKLCIDLGNYLFTMICEKIDFENIANFPKRILSGFLEGGYRGDPSHGPIVLWKEPNSTIQKVLNNKGLFNKRIITYSDSLSSNYPILPDSTFQGFWSGKMLDVTNEPTHLIIIVDTCTGADCAGMVIIKNSNLTFVNSQYDGGFKGSRFLARRSGDSLAGEFIYRGRPSSFVLRCSTVNFQFSPRQRSVMEGSIGISPVLLGKETINEEWDPLESTCRHASLSIL